MAELKGINALIMLAFVTCAAMISGCGFSSPIAESSASTGVSEAVKYADCMRVHGVPNFPDPGSGGGVQWSGSGIDTQSPAFRSAQNACQKQTPGGIGGPAGVSATSIGRGVKIAACIRAHGLRSFPDPTTSPPSAPPAPEGIILGGPDGVFSLTASMVQSPAFKRAATRCGFHFPTGHVSVMPVAAPSG